MLVECKRSDNDGLSTRLLRWQGARHGTVEAQDEHSRSDG
jgi:hypothetical protein